MRWLAILLAAAALPAQAQEAADIAASAPKDRSVTIYRAPYRNGGPMSLSRLGGFAVITETREVTLQAGLARLRFEGVADGIIPESAIVSGLPGGVIEKNRDDALLTPSALMRAAVGREVQLRRTDRKTGKVTMVPARLVSASDQGVLFATASGNEALRCSGLPEAFRFSGDAEGLSAMPTLSVRTRSAVPVHARVKLTYIAENFDWNANYIAHIRPDGRTLDLTGWITLANGTGVSLDNAQTQIVAGGLNRAYVARFVNDQPRVIARCWSMQSTSDIPERAGQPYRLVQPWMGLGDSEVIVSARRRAAFPKMMMVPAPRVAMAAIAPAPPQAEQLGDLKLYRVPERTTIAARQMKQTRLIDQPGVPFENYYRMVAQLIPWMSASAPQPATHMMRTHNDKAHHLGLPLPAGAILVEQDQGGQVMVLGEPALRDTAEDEKLDIAVGSANDITCAWARTQQGTGNDFGKLIVTLANASAHPAIIELQLNAVGGWYINHTSIDAPKVDGVPTVKLTLASGEQRQIDINLTRN